MASSSSVPSTPNHHHVSKASSGGSSSSSDTTKAARTLYAMQFHDCSDDAMITNPYHPPAVTSSKIRKMTFKLRENEYVIEDPVGAPSAQVGEEEEEMRKQDLFKRMVVKKAKKKNGGRSLKKLIARIGGSEPVLVIEKRLTYTDGNRKQGRLLIPKVQVKNDEFLTQPEKAKIGRKEDLPVWVFDPKHEKSTLTFGLCMMNNNTNYALKNKWNKVAEANKWKEGTVLQVWTFRVHLQLCFALVRVRA
ncbi:hypothetical protein L6452_25526 [Arctium lappa]|uniref:Uncharacterized protein n=1 Tax=Arctium lappa TaxID=4217 RepID=A0ACB9AB34_ARCLA|nr:hypothetical protein L6452_25526 [Arctium lappa]